MKTETSLNTNALHLNNNTANCKHPMLQPALNKSGFHTGLYVCVKCDKQIQDTAGILMMKELFF